MQLGPKSNTLGCCHTPSTSTKPASRKLLRTNNKSSLESLHPEQATKQTFVSIGLSAPALLEGQLILTEPTTGKEHPQQAVHGMKQHNRIGKQQPELKQPHGFLSFINIRAFPDARVPSKGRDPVDGSIAPSNSTAFCSGSDSDSRTWPDASTSTTHTDCLLAFSRHHRACSAWQLSKIDLPSN